MANEALLANIRKNLNSQERAKFDEAITMQDDTDISEAGIWQAYYIASPNNFFSSVLPKTPKTFAKIAFGNKPKTDELYLAAERIIAASPAFKNTELDLIKIAKAWDIVAKAANRARDEEKKYLAVHKSNANSQEAARLHTNTQKYESGAQRTFYNIVKSRSERFNVMLGLYNDANIKRRNKRIKKYLFREENDQIFARLNKKLDKLNSEGIKQIKSALNKEHKANVQQIYEQTLPQFTGSGPISRRAAKAVNSVTKSMIGVGIEKGYIDTNTTIKKQEADIMLAEDIRFLNEADGVFGLYQQKLKVPTYLQGNALDTNNINIADVNWPNLRETLKTETIKAAHENLQSSTSEIASKGKRGIRIFAFITTIIATVTSVGLAITFPPSIPFIAAFYGLFLISIASFLYFNKDPIPQVADQSKGILQQLSSTINEMVFPKKKPSFDIPEDTKKFLQSLDSEVGDLLQAHFQERAKNIEQSIAKQSDNNDIKIELDNLDNDWSNILIAAKNAAKTSNKEEFQKIAMAYLTHAYENIERPKFVEFAKRKKLLWDSERKIEDTTFAVEKNKIESLTKLADKIQHITSRPQT